MAETGSFESQVANLPPSSRREVLAVDLKQRERDAERSKTLRENHSELQKEEAAAGEQLLNSAFPDYAQDAEPKSGPPESAASRERIADYGNLADLAYVDFVSDSEGFPGSLEVKGASLDPLSFPNVRNLTSAPRSNLTEDEKLLAAYVNDTPLENFRSQLASFGKGPVPKDSADILYVASAGKFDASRIGEKMYARRLERETGVASRVPDSETEKYTANLGKIPGMPLQMSDSPYSRLPAEIKPMTEEEKLQTLRLQAGLEHVREYKAKEGSELFEDMKKKGYSVVDRFPDKENGESGSSGFAGMAVKDKQGRVTVAVRWTELTDFWDLEADIGLVFDSVPGRQARDLVRFMDRVLSKLPPDEKIRMSWHSLGGALTQIGSVMYGDRIEESYTFNSPGAKKLSANPGSQPADVRGRLEKYAEFGYDMKNPSSVENRIVNVAGSRWPSMIANLNEDVGFYEIKLEKVMSHSITTLVEEIGKESTELVVVDTREKYAEKSDATDTQP